MILGGVRRDARLAQFAGEAKGMRRKWGSRRDVDRHLHLRVDAAEAVRGANSCSISTPRGENTFARDGKGAEFDLVSKSLANRLADVGGGSDQS